MNFRTTILLLVVLAAAAVVYFVTSGRESSEPVVKTEDTGQEGKKLFDLASANVNKIVVTPASGTRLALEREGASEWRLTEPVKSPAEAFKVDDLVREVLELRTTGQSDPAEKGVDQPQYVIELTDKDGKTQKLNVGARSPVGDILYVRLDGQSQVDLVSASLIEQLEKPASEYRKAKLISVTNDQVVGVTVSHGDQTLKLTRGDGEDWKIIEPKQMPGDTAQISSLLSAITGLSAVKFVSEDLKDPAEFGLNKPQMTVTLTTAPAEPPAATGPTMQAARETTTIKFGRPQDVLKKNVFVAASDAGPVATVMATALDNLKKTPLDLRDRNVLEINPDVVSKVAITIDKLATTQPTTQPAEKKEIVLARRSEVAPAGPMTQPAATGPSTSPSTAPTTAPAKPLSKWLVLSEPKGDANDETVEALLATLRPLHAVKFLEVFPTTQAAPAGTYHLKISTRAEADVPAQEYDLKITDPGGEAKLLGQLGELSFELDRSVLEKLPVDFTAPTIQPAGPAFPGLPDRSTPPGGVPFQHP